MWPHRKQGPRIGSIVVTDEPQVDTMLTNKGCSAGSDVLKLTPSEVSEPPLMGGVGGALEAGSVRMHKADFPQRRDPTRRPVIGRLELPFHMGGL